MSKSRKGNRAHRKSQHSATSNGNGNGNGEAMAAAATGEAEAAPVGDDTGAATAAAPVVDTAPQPPVARQRPASRIAPRSAPITFSFGPPTRRVSATSVADPGAAVSIEPAGDEAAPAQRDAISRIAPIVIPSITIRPIEVKEIK